MSAAVAQPTPAIVDEKEHEEESSLPPLPSLESQAKLLVNTKAAIAKRMRCIFMIKHIGGDEAVKVLASALKSESVLLSHEIAYVLGQMQRESALPFLIDCLEDENVNVIVRHEVR